MYIVIRKSVFRHEVMGGDTDRKKALEIAVEAIKAEPDSYHSMQIVRVLLRGEEVYAEVIRKDQNNQWARITVTRKDKRNTVVRNRNRSVPFWDMNVELFLKDIFKCEP